MTGILTFTGIGLLSVATLLPTYPLHTRVQPRSRDGPSLMQRLRFRTHTPITTQLDTAADLDLFAVCLDAGLSQAHAASAVAEHAAIPAWQQVAALLRMGIADERAWQAMREEPTLAELIIVVRHSVHSGAALATSCRRIATNLRSNVMHTGQEQAERAGVFITLPLTLCFLPAFILTGLLPVVMSMGLTIFGS